MDSGLHTPAPSQEYLYTGVRGRKPFFACHSEGATSSRSMTEWKIFSGKLIETPATEETLIPGRY